MKNRRLNGQVKQRLSNGAERKARSTTCAFGRSVKGRCYQEKSTSEVIEQAVIGNTRCLGAFVTEDHRGKHLPRFFIDATRQMAGQEVMILEQVESLVRSIDHIKTIVATQQAYATGVSAVVEEVSLAELLEDAIRINSASMQRHSLQVEREFDDIER